MLFEWRVTDGGSPLSGAFCKIPNTPNAVDHLLAKVLFIDPKTMKGNSTNSTHTASMMMAADTYTLTPVVVFAVPTWTADMAGSSFSYYNDLSVPSWNDPGTGSYYDVPGDACDDPNNPNASGLIISAPSSPLMTDPVDACEKNRSGSAPFYCIDIYIAACNVGGLQGDCRNADPNAPASGSRAQIRFPETLGGGDPAVYLHETCITGSTLCTSPLGPPDNNVSIAYMGTDSIAVTFHLTNSMTSAGGRVGTPSIDGSVVFVKGDYGIFWPVAGSRDAFPSMSVYYQYQYGQIQLLQRDEQNFFNLIDHFGWTDNWQLCVPQ